MDRKLQRDENKKMLGGVAAGLAEYFELDVTVVRVIFVLMAVFGLAGVLIYLILWIVVPAKPLFDPYGGFNTGYKTFSDIPPAGGVPFEPAQTVRKRSKGRVIAGAVLVLLGLYFLFDQFFFLPPWFALSKLWPVVLIVIGAMILGKSSKRNTFSGFHDVGEQGPAGDTNATGGEEQGGKPLM